MRSLSQKSLIDYFVPLSALIFLWALVIRQLSLEWTVNSLYQYGWFVIPLAAYLFYERTRDVPPKSSAGDNYLLTAFLASVSIVYVPFRIIQEANFDWILLNWLVAISAIAITLCYIHQLGGKNWVVHFAFPILFIFSAIPWPVSFENAILQNLMKANASITAHLLSIGYMDAVARGNIIEIGGQLIGVEEACSGIRSLQTSFMMSLFLGEFYRLNRFNRAWLVLISFFLAFLFNLCRTIILTYIGASEGLFALESWHDPLGYGTLIVTLLGLWGTALWYSEKNHSEAANSMTFVNYPPCPSTPPHSKSGMFAVFILTACGGELASEYWYGSKEKYLVKAQNFTVDFPLTAKGYEENEFSEITKKILKFNHGHSANWETETGDGFGAYLLEWNPGRVSQKLVSAHTPEVCYPAAGFKLESFIGIERLNFGDLTLNFKTYLFRNGSTFFYVFHGVWNEKFSPEDISLDMEPLSREQRLRTVLQGKRNLGQKILGISVMGPNSIEEAKHVVNKTLSNIIVPIND